MTVIAAEPKLADALIHKPAIIFSSDTHIGPRLREDLRPYCPKDHLAAFDAYLARHESLATPEFEFQHPNGETAGHHEIHARLDDYDRDGIAGGVLFHFSQNGEPFPFGHTVAGTGGLPSDIDDLDLAAVGLDIYNRWTSDFISVQKERHVGLGFLPLWDIDESVRLVPKMRELGMKGINLPPPRPGILEYNRPEWDPFWAACVDHNLTLTTHANPTALANYSGPGGMALMAFEVGGYMSVRALWWMILGGVFERFPKLKIVFTETIEGWYQQSLHMMDVICQESMMGAPLKRLPSEYGRSNVFVGASVLSPFLVDDAIRQGWSDNVLFGNDYPHIEGAFRSPLSDAGISNTAVSLSHILKGQKAEDVVGLLGRNAANAYDIDLVALQAVADRIGAATPAELVAHERDVTEIGRAMNMAYYDRPFYHRG